MKIDIQLDSENRHPDGLAKIAASVAESDMSYELDLPFSDLSRRFGAPNNLSLDLLLTASLCYVIDKMVPRAQAEDFWTRNFELEIPVADVDRWSGVSETLCEMLGFLTGDIWQITFRERESQLFQAPPPKRRRRIVPQLDNINAVCALSGGVDSLVGAIDLLEDEGLEGVHLIGHYDAPGAKKPQADLFTSIAQQYPGRSELLQVRVSHKPLKSAESSLRSRSFVFFAIGLYAARAAGAQIPLYMPENGFIALNVPLTPSRAGSCSTRTMHPYYLVKLRSVLQGLGIDNPLINPLEYKTKGECVADCSNLNFLRSIIDKTVSCSHGTRKQYWARRTQEIRNCGYCVPCLIRRASLHQANLDDPNFYGLDICAGEVDYSDDKKSSDDTRAIMDAIKSNKLAADFEKDIIAVAYVDSISERARMIERGLNEIKVMIQDKATPEVLRTVGLPARI